MYKIVSRKELNPTVTLIDVEAPFIAKKGEFLLLLLELILKKEQLLLFFK